MPRKRKTGGKRGRPTKYNPEICDKVPSMFANGESQNEVAAALEIDRDTFKEWKKTHPEFKRAVDMGLELSEAWWERLGRAGSTGKINVNATLWIFNMKNRFGWKDKSEIDGHGITLVIDKETQKALN
jgi:transposase